MQSKFPKHKLAPEPNYSENIIQNQFQLAISPSYKNLLEEDGSDIAWFRQESYKIKHLHHPCHGLPGYFLELSRHFKACL